MARLMDNKVTMDLLQERLVNVAKKYARKAASIELDDFIQELWVWMCEKQPEDLAWATVQMENRCKDLLRKDYRVSGGITSMDMKDPLTDVKLYGPKPSFLYGADTDSEPYQKYDPSLSHGCFDSPSENAESADNLIRFLDVLGSRERMYVIAKGYLSGNLVCYKDLFKDLLSQVDDERREILSNAKKVDSDDTILKVFLNIKTGVNSGSARAVKNNVGRAVISYFGYNPF